MYVSLRSQEMLGAAFLGRPYYFLPFNPRASHSISSTAWVLRSGFTRRLSPSPDSTDLPLQASLAVFSILLSPTRLP